MFHHQLQTDCTCGNRRMLRPFSNLKLWRFGLMFFKPFVTKVCLFICRPAGHGAAVFPEQEDAVSCAEIKPPALSWHVLTWFWGVNSAGSRTDNAEKRLQTIERFSSGLSLNARWLLTRAEAGAPPVSITESQRGKRENGKKVNCICRTAGGWKGRCEWPESDWTFSPILKKQRCGLFVGFCGSKILVLLLYF